MHLLYYNRVIITSGISILSDMKHTTAVCYIMMRIFDTKCQCLIKVRNRKRKVLFKYIHLYIRLNDIILVVFTIFNNNVNK